MAIKIIDIRPDNIRDYKSICFCKKDSVGYNKKIEWITERLKEGLKIKFLTSDEDNIVHGYIEYIDGEFAWRSVDAKGYIFIHCIRITPNNFKNKGYGSMLINECIKDAKGKTGVVVMSSNDSFMASKLIFLKNGFELIEQDGKQQLLVKKLKKGDLPKFNDYKKQLAKYKGWHIVYSNQCPWVSRFISELDSDIVKKLDLKITELKSSKDAQNAPSLYSVFNLIKDGKILADHYISSTRFNNILKKNS